MHARLCVICAFISPKVLSSLQVFLANYVESRESDIAKVSSPKMLCQGFNGATFSYCLFVGPLPSDLYWGKVSMLIRTVVS